MTYIADGDEKESDERHGDEGDGGPAVEICDFAIEQGQSEEDKEEMRAEDMERSLAEGKERLAGDGFNNIFAQCVQDDTEADEIEDAEWADLPFIELNAERLLVEVRAEPSIADEDEQNADDKAGDDRGAGNVAIGGESAGESGAEPEAGDPHGLPCEEIEGSGLLQGNVEMSEVDDPVVHEIAQAELGEEPDEHAGGEDDFPANAGRERQERRREEQKDDVHRKDVQQWRAIEQKERADDRRGGVRDVEVEQVGDGDAVRINRISRGYSKCEEEQNQVIAVDFERAAEELAVDSGLVALNLMGIDVADEQGRHEDEALGGADKADGAVEEVADAGGQVDERHPDEEEPAQGVQLRTAFELGHSQGHEALQRAFLS